MLLETSGSIDIALVPKGVHVIMDVVRTPVRSNPTLEQPRTS